MNWDDLIARKGDFVGGTIETHESDDDLGEYTFRGRIARVSVEGGLFCVETKTIIVRKDRDEGTAGPWEDAEAVTIFASMDFSRAWDAGQGAVSFSIPFIGTATLYPRGVLRV